MAPLRVIVLAVMVATTSAFAAGTRAPRTSRVMMMAKGKPASSTNLNSRESMRERMDAARSNANVAVGRTDRKQKVLKEGEMSGKQKNSIFWGTTLSLLAGAFVATGGVGQ
eukprot:CAMPEP_0182538424 /NCGR_PEP_ID=MMETSP1323-20130603/23662_1 /TAXON_ID=236787 /ORGANISM="Florenciella parvula, Strain RCC1693" /LENGTH=110 /DNA_ID=CAMNT_0024748885 /DNA_START=92 /DNA_END=424 /DNA_ORIENTATION=+